MSLSEEDNNLINQAFIIADRTKKGKIGIKDSLDVLRYCGLFIEEADITGKGSSFTVEQIKELYISNIDKKKGKTELKEAFDNIFKENEGKVKAKELKHGLISFSQQLSKEKIEEIFKELNIKEDDEIVIEDFIDKILNSK